MFQRHKRRRNFRETSCCLGRAGVMLQNVQITLRHEQCDVSQFLMGIYLQAASNLNFCVSCGLCPTQLCAAATNLSSSQVVETFSCLSGINAMPKGVWLAQMAVIASLLLIIIFVFMFTIIMQIVRAKSRFRIYLGRCNFARRPAP